MVAGAAATGRKPVAGVDGRRSRAPYHVLDQGNTHEIPARIGGSPTGAQHRDRSYGAACGTAHFGAHRRHFWNFARAAFLELSASGGAERGHRERVRGAPEGATRERLGSGANFTITAASNLRWIVHPQFPECATN